VTYDVTAVLRGVLQEIHAPADNDTLPPSQACQPVSTVSVSLWQPGCSNYNSFGPGGTYHVRNYPDAETGERATALTLENGHYPHVLDALRRGDLGAFLHDATVSHELDVWGTGGAHVRSWLLAHRAGQPAPTPPPHPHTVYVVRAGDTLSGIAARYRLAGGWQELYRTNRSVIGGDPNEIRVGERLVIA